MSIKNAKSQLGAFIDAEPETVEDTKPVKRNTQKAATPTETTTSTEAPEGYVMKREPKSKRTSILLRPSTYNKLVEAAEAAGTSVNEYISDLIERNVSK